MYSCAVVIFFAHKRQGKSISVAGACLRDLQIEGYTFAVD